MEFSRRRIDLLFAVTAFTASSLIFLIQPIIARELLPTLGGAPAVWTACMLFFQTCLLVGYAWAHFGPKLLGDRVHAISHLLLLLSLALFLPVTIRTNVITTDGGNPALQVLTLLAVSFAMPMCILSATSPLIQRWHGALNPNRGDRVYRLYSIGNIASLIVLLAYPFIIEPFTTLGQQRLGWSILLGGVALLLVAGALARISAPATSPDSEAIASAATSLQWIAWLLLSAIPSSYLLGVTSYLTSDVAAVPFLWVIPLALYLAAFSVAFAGRKMPDFIRNALAPGMALLCLVFIGSGWTTMSVPMTVALHIGTFFLLVVSCLGELYRRRPDQSRLTQFYLVIAVGGVMGGIFNSLLAPTLFRTTVEYPFALLLCAAMAIHWPTRNEQTQVSAARDRTWLYVGMVLVLLVAATTYAAQDSRLRFGLGANWIMLLMGVPMLICYVARRRPVVFALCTATLSGTLLAMGTAGFGALDIHRSFFGVHRVTAANVNGRDVLELYHGTTLHGRQFSNGPANTPLASVEPLTYYHREGPLGQVIRYQRPMRLGVVGLGVGSIAGYVGKGQSLAYFEIDPVVIELAERSPFFSFLRDAILRGARIRTVPGDARLTLREEPVGAFDLLVIDAFSGDAIPVHLLTREAFTMYADRVAANGTIAIHISNHYLDLSQVVANGVALMGGTTLMKDESNTPEVEATPGRSAATWVICTRDSELATTLIADGWSALNADGRTIWTDDYSNLLRVLK